MKTTLYPYLSFRKNAREAMEFYRSVFGGKVTFATFKDFNASESPDDDNLIMHAMLEGGNGITFMGADTPGGMEYDSGTNISMTLNGDNDAELSSYFERLSAGGTIIEPLAAAPWGDKFGMFVDRFGINWMVNIEGKKS